MILDFSVDTTSNREVTEAIDLLLYVKHGSGNKIEPKASTRPVEKTAAPVVVDPRQMDIIGAVPTLEKTETVEKGIDFMAALKKSVDAKTVQDLTRKLMNSGKDGVAEATRCLGAVSATSLSKVPAERMAEYVALVQKALDMRASAQ